MAGKETGKNELENDPNYLAYQADVKSGSFKGMERGTWVAYQEGQRIASGTREEVIDASRGRDKETFIHQVNSPEEVVDVLHIFKIWGPRIRKRKS